MKPQTLVLALAVALAVGPRPAVAQEAAAPRRVILVVGDGVGLTQWSAGLVANDSLAVAALPEIGLVDTRCVCRGVTDSGASATAYAIGARTFLSGIGMDADSVPRTTALEWAERRGMATGLVTTTQIVDATPAAFAAHVPTRYMYADIATQMAGQGIEVLLGGGRGWFDGTLRPDSQNLIPALRERYTYVESARAFDALRPDTLESLLGLFAPTTFWPDSLHLRPGLPEMAEAALAVLDKDPDGFFLLLESEDTDDVHHDNLPMDRVGPVMAELDRTIRVALDYQRRHPETLVVVTGDHETGGMMLGLDGKTGAPVASYGTRGHSATMVPLFAGGPGAAAFGRVLSNAQVGILLREAVAPGAGNGPAPDAEDQSSY